MKENLHPGLASGSDSALYADLESE
jgi:hypothetical protein